MRYQMSENKEKIDEADTTPLTALGSKQCSYLSAISRLLYELVREQKKTHDEHIRKKRKPGTK